jgi:hypothetical protein
MASLRTSDTEELARVNSPVAKLSESARAVRTSAA